MSEPITVVSWLWRQRETWNRHYTADHVNALERMVKQHLHIPHKFVCVTDDPAGINCRTIPLWPMPTVKVGHNKPNCYKRLYAFSKNVGCWFGKRFVSIDIDCLLMPGLDGRGITPLLENTDDFRILNGIRDGRGCCPYNGSIWMMNTGVREKVWTDFNPLVSPQQSWTGVLPNGKRFYGSDQAWIAYKLPEEKTWTRADGICSYVKDMKNNTPIPNDCRIMFFAGANKPWMDIVRECNPVIYNEYKKYL